MHTNECPKYAKVLIRILKEFIGKYWESTVKIPGKYQAFNRKLQGIYHTSSVKVLGKYQKILEKYQKSIKKKQLENTWKDTKKYLKLHGKKLGK